MTGFISLLEIFLLRSLGKFFLRSLNLKILFTDSKSSPGRENCIEELCVCVCVRFFFDDNEEKKKRAP